MQKPIPKKPISIRRALKTVASDNYDKKNIFFYFILVLIPSIFAFSAEEKSNINPMISLLSVLIMLFGNAVYTVAQNNAVHKRKGVFPDILKNITSVFRTAVALFVGNAFWIVLMLIVTAIFMLPLLGVNIAVAIIVSIIPLLILATFYIGAYFNFFITLSFKDWFNLKKSLTFMKSAKKYFAPFLYRSILLAVAGAILMLLTGIICGLFISFLQAEQQAIAETGIQIFCASVVATVISIYLLEITAQFLRATLREPKQTVKQKN